MIKISVIIPIHNSSKYLDRLLFSLQNQTLKELEFIFVENGSADESYKNLLKIANKEPRARVFNIGKSTIGGAINFGIAQSKGEFIAINDHDDFYVQDGLLKLYENISSNNALAVISNIINISCKTRGDNSYNNFRLQTRSRDIFCKAKISTIGWACLVKRDFFMQHGIKYMDTNMHHDTMFFIDLWQTIYAQKRGDKLVNFMPDYVSYVRIVEPSTSLTHNNNSTTNKMYKTLQPSIYIFKVFAEIVEKNKALYKNIPNPENILFLWRDNATLNILMSTLLLRFSKLQLIAYTYYLAKFYKKNKNYFKINYTLPHSRNMLLYDLDKMAGKRSVISFFIRIIKLANLITESKKKQAINEVSLSKLHNNKHDDENCFCSTPNFDIKKEILNAFYKKDTSSIISKENGTMFW